MHEGPEETTLQDERLLPGQPPVLAPGHTFGSLTDKIADIVLRRPLTLGWSLGVAFFATVALLLLFAATYLFVRGVGIWGINIPIGWGFAIINFVWWIGIGHAGTLISAILLLLKQSWRNSINRFAEAMTLFAVACAGMFPVLHLGRPWLAYWLFPYPNTMGVWPQFRSPLVWDVFAVSTYGTISLVFWYVGLIPDLATMRDKARHPWAKAMYGILAMGWRGSVRHWKRYESAYLLLAGLATPLVLSVHTVVSFDFAVAHRSGLAHDDFSALLRRRRHLLGLRHGAGAGDSDPPLLRAEGHDHHAAPGQCRQGHAGHRLDRRLRLWHGSFLCLVQRQPVGEIPDDEPHVRPVWLLLLAARSPATSSSRRCCGSRRCAPARSCCSWSRSTCSSGCGWSVS